MTEAIVTIVIVNYNGEHLLPACLDAVARQDMPAGSYETIVVDNASRDASLELLSREYPWVYTIANPRNDGFAGGNNVALERVETPFVALLNNDAVPDPDWLRTLLATFDLPGGERTGAVTSKLVFMPRFLEVSLATDPFTPGPRDSRELGVRIYSLSVNGHDAFGETIWDGLAYPEENDGARFRWTRGHGTAHVPVPERGKLSLKMRVAAETLKPVELAWPGGSASFDVGFAAADVVIDLEGDAPRADVLNNAGGYINTAGFGGDRAFRVVDRGQFDTRQPVFNACGAAVCFRMAALKQTGFFDEDFFLYYEDADLSWRLQSRGWAIMYEPAARVRHIHSATSEEWSPLFTFHVERNRLLMLTKNASGRILWVALALYLRDVVRGFGSIAKHGTSRARPAMSRVHVLASYLRFLPAAMRHRREIARTAVVSRRRLERRLTRID